MALPAKNTETKNTSTLQLEEFVLYTDGASRGNPGQAAAGVSLVDSRGQEIVGEGLYLGQTTNNVAEYKALLFGLEKARSLGVVNLAIKLDSELIVRQLQGRYKVKNEKLIPLFVQTEKILADLKSYRISHVPRSENKRADQLANEALDNQQTNC
ncbi:MAG: ribonuclease HI family protein [Proteobacteria bacterium]|nr:ribonuclease HI family protein [Pseudomonadota bacterium]MBU1715316.1 ribonuclease HI family protein [Pseudomonadota bacterium]